MENPFRELESDVGKKDVWNTLPSLKPNVTITKTRMCERKLLNRWNEATAKEKNIRVYTINFQIHNTILMKATDSCRSTTVNPEPYLFIQVYQGLIRQLQGLDGLQDCVPVAAVDVGYETLYAVHRVQGHRGLLL